MTRRPNSTNKQRQNSAEDDICMRVARNNAPLVRISLALLKEQEAEMNILADALHRALTTQD